jgi:hypothetical protein
LGFGRRTADRAPRKETGQEMKTADGVEITDGMRVWDYNLERGTVDLGRLDDLGWFDVRTDDGGRSYMNAERVCVRHPFTRESA